MNRFFALAACTLLTGVVGQGSPPALAKKAFLQSGLVPDVLASFNPLVELDVTYEFNNTLKRAFLGNNFPRPDTVNRPQWSVPDIAAHPELDHATFVVAMVDPDAPTPAMPTSAQIRHFLGGGFKFIGNTLVNNTPALSDYRQPTPPAGSPAHRYTFLLFLQSSTFPTSLDTPIQNFNISAFAGQFGLGQPLGGNFIRVMNTTSA